MPKLSKFRVVNLVYNDTRHIYDEVFDFNEGDHAMMLLANGGGKTVLTQMMLQPVIPKTDLKTRKFADYFRNNTKPTLLMTEWTLDSEAGKLLTGLVIKNTIRKKRGQDEDRELLNIYGFVIHYHYHDTFNIDTVPVISRDGQGHKIMRSYDEILLDLQKHERQNKAFVSLFNWSDSAEAKRLYKEKLGEYGIVQQEWADNILKINKEEAGLKSFFNDAKTSTTLLKRKIFPSIESKLEENNLQRVEIQTLVKSHAMELVKNDKIIQDERLYNSFLEDCDVYEKKVMVLAEIEEDLEEAYEYLSQVYSGLQKFEILISNKVNALEQDKRDNRSMSNHIKFEEACFKYFKKQDAFQRVLDEIQEIESSIETLVRDIEVTQTLKDNQAAIEIYDKMKDLMAKIVFKEEALSSVLSKEKDMDIEMIMSVLYQKYQTKKSAIQEQVKVSEAELESIQDGMDTMLHSQQTLDATIREDEARQTLEEHAINQYEGLIQQLNRGNDDFKWEKHQLLNSYEQQELKVYLKQLQSRQKALKSDEERTTKAINDIHINIKETSEKISKSQVQQISSEHQYVAAKEHLEAYLRIYEERIQEIVAYGISKEQIFETDAVIDDLRGMIEERKTAISQYTVDRSTLVQMGESLKAGRLNTLPEDVVNFLDMHGIGFEYGYQWLRNYQGEKIPESLYLEYLRVLPYALIMSQKDLERFRLLSKSYHLSTIIPMVSQDYIKYILESGPIADTEMDVYYHTAFDEQLLVPSRLSEKIEEVEERIIDIDHEEKLVNDNINKLQVILYRYADFVKTYSQDSYASLVQIRDDAQLEVEKWDDLIKASEAALIQFQEKLKGLEDLKLVHTKDMEENGSLLRDYTELDEGYQSYDMNKTVLSKISKTLTNNRRNLEELRTSIEGERQQAQLVKKHLEKNNLDMIVLESKMSPIQSTVLTMQQEDYDHPYFIESLESLEGKVDAYSRNHGDAANIKELLTVFNRSLLEEEQRLLKLDVQETVYKEGVFDQELFMTASKRLDEQSGHLKSLSEKKSNLKTLANEKESAQRSMKEEILATNAYEDLLPRTAIINLNFSERKKDNQRLYNAMDDSLKSLSRLNNVAKSSMKRLEDAMDQKEFLPCVPSVFVLETTAVEIDLTIDQSVKTLKSVLSQYQKQRSQITSDYNQLTNRYEKKNELLGNMFTNLLKGDNIFNSGFVSRVFKQTRESIRRTKEKYETDLKNIKKSEETLFDFTLTKVSSVYDQLKDIDKHSTIELHDKHQKMLYITLPKKETLEGTKLNNYLKEVIRVTKHRIQEGELAELDRYLDNHLKLEQLFDEYIPIHSIGISVAKIEQNKVSKISWEEVSKTSGGEVFVSVFILFISLLSYTRGYQLSRKQQGKALVMDNPFGPVSSGHLLEPLFKIAATYDTQLICFTHINTSAITSQFDLIYSLRVIREAGSTKEHLDVKLAKNAAAGVEVIESSLFEISDGDQLGFL